jgi:hypothetical protein
MAWTKLEQFIDDSPGAVWGAEEAQEIIDNAGGGATTTIVTGNFSGTTGTGITFADQGNTNYAVIVTALGTGSGDIGEITYTRDLATDATIYNTGSNTGAFVAVIVKGAA